METLNPQAKELNEILKKDNPVIYDLLSEKGKAIFFPKKGILAQTADAKGKKINATIGAAIEDDGSPMRLPSISNIVNLDPKDVFPYAPSFGKPELRKTWQELIHKKNPSLKNRISLPIVTCALTHGINTVVQLFANPGECIHIPDKFWGNYRLMIENGHLVNLKTFNTFKNNGFDTEALKESLEKDSSSKKIVLLNFPNNPSGYTPTTEEARKIVEIIKNEAEKGTKLLVIIDDAYFGLVYEEGIYRESLFAPLSDVHTNVHAIKIDGATKEEYAWGFRVGFITYASKNITQESCKALELKTAGIVRGSISNAPHISQSLILKALSSPGYESEKKEKSEILKNRYRKVRTVLKNKKFKKHFTPLPFNSGYFMCIELKENTDSEKIRKILLEKHDTGIIALGNIIRIAFSSVAEKNIEELFENIYITCEEISNS